MCGALIRNVFLSTLGLNDFSLIQPYYLATGISFVVYAVAPIIVGISPWLAVQLGKPKSLNRRLKVTLLIGMPFIAFMLIGTGLHYFVPDIYIMKARWFIPLAFWKIYWVPCFTICLIGFWIPVVALFYIKKKRPILELFKRIIMVQSAVGFFSLIVPFATYVYPNLKASVGGGQAKSIDLLVDQEIPFLSGSIKKESTLFLYEQLVMWHQNERMLFVSEMKNTSKVKVVGVKADSVQAIEINYFSLPFNSEGYVEAFRIDLEE